MYLHEKENWTQFTIDYERICPSVASVRHHQGRVLAQFLTAGVITSNKACLEAFVEEVSKSAEIEGEKFDPGHVRSSLCRRLGVDFPDDGRSVPRTVDGAVRPCFRPVTADFTRSRPEGIATVKCKWSRVDSDMRKCITGRHHRLSFLD